MLKLIQNPKKILFAAALVTVASLPGHANDKVYDYHPNSPLALGRGFEPNTLTEPKLNCLEFERKEDIQNGAATSTSFLMRTVSSMQDLKRKLGVDFSLDARYLKVKGGTTFNLNKESNFEKNTLNVLIVASSEYGSVSMKNPKLNEYGKQLIDNGHHDLFRKECGSHLITNEIMGARVGVMLTIRNLSNKTSNTIKNTIKFGYDAGSMSIDLKNDINKMVKNASKNNSLEISIFATGSTGVDKVGTFAEVLSAQEGALEKIQAALGTYMKEFNFNSSVPVRFLSKPFGFGFEAKYENLWKAHNERKIQRIAEAYRKLNYQVEVVRKIHEGVDLRASMLNHDEIEELVEESYDAEDYLDNLVELHRICQFEVYSQTKPDAVNDGSKPVECKFKKSEVPEIELPDIPEVPILVKNLASPSELRSKLMINGFGVASLRLLAIQDGAIQEFSTEDFPIPDKVELDEIEVDLTQYWGHVASKVRGSVRGVLIISDYFGRQVTYVFHHAAYPEFGGQVPYFDLFDPEGL